MDIINPFSILIFFIGLGVIILFLYNFTIEKHLNKKKIYFLGIIILVLFTIDYVLTGLFLGEEFNRDRMLITKFLYYFSLSLLCFPISLLKKGFWPSISRFCLFLVSVILVWEIIIYILGLPLPVPVMRDDLTIATLAFMDFVTVIVGVIGKTLTEMVRFQNSCKKEKPS